VGNFLTAALGNYLTVHTQLTGEGTSGWTTKSTSSFAHGGGVFHPRTAPDQELIAG
jgi:hypothetical protein